MAVPVTLEALDLAALLCSRVCHDLISPVGAVVNGIEVMEDDADEQTKQFAIELIKKSANTASAAVSSSTPVQSGDDGGEDDSGTTSSTPRLQPAAPPSNTNIPPVATSGAS